MTWECAGMTWVGVGMTWECAGMMGFGGNDGESNLLRPGRNPCRKSKRYGSAVLNCGAVLGSITLLDRCGAGGSREWSTLECAPRGKVEGRSCGESWRLRW